MKHLFPAIEARYAAFAELVRIGRKVFEASEEEPPNYAGNYVLVEGEQDDGAGTFGGDLQQWVLRFGLVSKALRSDDAQQWLRHMDAAFKDCGAGLLAPDASFRCVGTWEFGKQGPRLAGHTYRAAWSCRIMIELNVKNPYTRVA